MYTNGQRSSMTTNFSSVLPQSSNQDSSSGGDEESEIILLLERKRKELDDEVTAFRAQKEKEFKDFERELRASRRKKVDLPLPQNKRSARTEAMEKPPSRTSSSSALNLLAGRASTRQVQPNNIFKKRVSENSPRRNTPARAGPVVSQPVVSLDKLNIKGETTIPQSPRPHTPPTPTLLSRSIAHSSSESSLATSPPPSKKERLPASFNKSRPKVSPDEEKHRDSFSGLFTPSYLPLIGSKSQTTNQPSSALETPFAEDEAATAPSSFKSNTLSEILPVSSSSFPPHVTLSPGGHSHPSKRAYTAPTVSPSRIPSALRTASGGTLGRKAKHVTFRLADSAIVEPSSSYEEGISPQLEDEEEAKSKSGTRSPLRVSKSQLHRTLSPDEEDAEAGVQPGMGMGDVINRLNEYTIAEAAKHGEKLVLEVEDNAAPDTEEDEDDEDDEDLPMVISSQHQDNLEDDSDRHFDVDYHEHEDEADDSDEDGYFSPKTKHVSTMSPIARGNSPLVPYRDDNWAELSSSDKDRLLFESRRHSDDSDDTRRRRNKKMASLDFDEKTGFSGKFQQSVDGGSGVGFFELDEELASPDAGQARPFELEAETDDLDLVDVNQIKDFRNSGLGLSTISEKGDGNRPKRRSSTDATSKFGVGSVPIDIVRPSLSVSSSWVGTFGH